MYSKEHIKPKLHQLDQDKLARLYADLRRESLATGSFPITVRHLESMIRMSEASAKMHLREYVRSDDIDLAIQVTVGSFVNAQKMSIKKTLERVSFIFFFFITSPHHIVNIVTLTISSSLPTLPFVYISFHFLTCTSILPVIFEGRMLTQDAGLPKIRPSSNR